MPRASDGTYSLPAGNPVATLSVISSTWANTTLSDISTALTGSLDRSGQGAMLAGLKLFDGVIGAPGLTWGTDTTSGLYKNGAADFRFSISAVDLLQLGTNLFQVSGTAPVVRINESDAAANNRLWDVIASGEDLNFRVLTDALVATNWLTVTRTAGVVDSIALAATAASFNGTLTLSKVATNGIDGGVILNSTIPQITLFESDGAVSNKGWYIRANAEALTFATTTDDGSSAVNWLTVERTGTTVDTINFGNGTLQYGGREVGYRKLPFASQAGNYTFVAGDSGLCQRYTGGGGNTFSINNAVFSGDEIVTIINSGTGNLTIGGTITTLAWYNGSGAISTGGRTLAVGGIATFLVINSTFIIIWGTGLS